MPKETIERRAVLIAAKIMEAEGLCIYDNPMKCHRLWIDETTCDKCIKAWLLRKAKKELGRA